MYIRHALAIDEYRKDFARVKWGGSGTARQRVGEEPEPFQQVWFAGCHADVGSGYPENESRISEVSRKWIVDFPTTDGRRTERDDRRSAFRRREHLPLVGWLALVLAPLARARLVAAARVVARVLAVGYAIGIAVALAAGGGPMPDLTTLSGLAHAFSTPRVMPVGWVHYLAFDLWVGAWETKEAGRRAMPHAALVPCLALTFLAGPVGLLLCLVLRIKWRPSACAAWRRGCHSKVAMTIGGTAQQHALPSVRNERGADAFCWRNEVIRTRSR